MNSTTKLHWNVQKWTIKIDCRELCMAFSFIYRLRFATIFIEKCMRCVIYIYWTPKMYLSVGRWFICSCLLIQLVAQQSTKTSHFALPWYSNVWCYDVFASCIRCFMFLYFARHLSSLSSLPLSFSFSPRACVCVFAFAHLTFNIIWLFVNERM